MTWSEKWSWVMYSLLDALRKRSEHYSPAAVGMVIVSFYIALCFTNCMQLLLSFAIDLLVTQNKFYLLLMEQREQRKIKYLALDHKMSCNYRNSPNPSPGFSQTN